MTRFSNDRHGFLIKFYESADLTVLPREFEADSFPQTKLHHLIVSIVSLSMSMIIELSRFEYYSVYRLNSAAALAVGWNDLL